MSENPIGLNPTDITFKQIYDKVNERIQADGRFRNMQQSDVSVMLMELFGSINEMLTYNVERTAEETFFDTLKRHRSAIKNSNNLAYDVQRPIPAIANIKIRISATTELKNAFNSGDEATLEANRTIIIPKNTKLTYDGEKYILTNNLKYRLTDAELFKLTGGEDIDVTTWSSDDDSSISILQGEIKLIEFNASSYSVNFTTDGNGKAFQKYYIDDETFSNFYGDRDPYGDTTIIGIGSYYDEAMGNNSHEIRRRSLLTGRDIDSMQIRKAEYFRDGKVDELKFYETSLGNTVAKAVLVKSSSEAADGKGVELKFGDGITTSLGAKNSSQTVFCQYLSTSGTRGNREGVVGNEFKIELVPGNTYNIYFNITPIFETNLVGGADLESIEMIKLSAPSTFQAFDRLVTKKDYKAFLEQLTSPIDVKNAIAWGEQDELKNTIYHEEVRSDVENFAAIQKLFNIVLYTVIGNLYEEVPDGDSVVIRPKENMFNTLLDNYSGDYIYPSQNYINIIGTQDVVKQLKLDDSLLDGSVPLQNIKFDIQYDVLTDPAQNKFRNLYSNLAAIVTNNISATPVGSNVSRYDEFKVRMNTLPMKFNWTLSNNDSDAIVDLEYTQDDSTLFTLFDYLDINNTYNVNYPQGSASGYYDAFTNNFNGTFTERLFSTTDNTEFELNGNFGYFDVIQLQNSLGVAALTVDATKDVDGVTGSRYRYVPNIILDTQTPKLPGETGSLNTIRTNTNSGLYSMLESICGNYMGTNNDPNSIIGRVVDGEIVPYTPGYTAFGTVVNELSYKLNETIRRSLISNDITLNVDKVLAFNFIDLNANIEIDTNFNNLESEGTSYITRLKSLLSSIDFSSDLSNSDRLYVDEVKGYEGLTLLKDYNIIENNTVLSEAFLYKFKTDNFNNNTSEAYITADTYDALAVEDQENYVEYGINKYVETKGSFRKKFKIKLTKRLIDTLEVIEYDGSTIDNNTLDNVVIYKIPAVANLEVKRDAANALYAVLEKAFTNEFDINGTGQNTDTGTLTTGSAKLQFTPAVTDVGQEAPLELNLIVDDITNFNIDDNEFLQNIFRHIIDTSGSLKTYILSKKSIETILKAFAIVKRSYDEYIENIYNYITGEVYIKPLQIEGNYNNLLTEFDDNGVVVSKGTNYTNLSFELLPQFEYMYASGDYDKVTYRRRGIDVNAAGILYHLMFTDVDESYPSSYEAFHANYCAEGKPLQVEWNNKSKSIKDLFGITTSANFSPYYLNKDIVAPNDKYSGKIGLVNKYLKEKNQITTKSIYISPIIHYFKLVGDIYVNDLAPLAEVEKKIKNDIYKFMMSKGNFNEPLYLSNLIEIIEAHPNVNNANVKLTPYQDKLKKPIGQQYYFDVKAFNTTDNHYIYSIIPTKAKRAMFRKIVMDALRDYVTKYQLATVKAGNIEIPNGNKLDRSQEYNLYEALLDDFSNSGGLTSNANIKSDDSKHLFQYKASSLSFDVTERTFLNELCKRIIKETEEAEIISPNKYLITKHKYFFMLLAELHNDFRPIIESNMLNDNGNISEQFSEEILLISGEYQKEKLRGGYSINNEIIQLFVDTNFTYR
jgi:hypothetical protein